MTKAKSSAATDAVTEVIRARRIELVNRLYASEWGGRCERHVRMRGGCGRLGQVTPPAWSSTRSR